MIQCVDFPVVLDIKTSRALIYNRVAWINPQQATRNNAVLYVGLALRFIRHPTTRIRALEFQSMAGPFFQDHLQSVVTRRRGCGDIDIATEVRVDVLVEATAVSR